MTAADRSWYAGVRSDIAGVAWPPVTYGAPAVLLALSRHLDDSQWHPPGTLAAGQHRQLAVLAEHFAGRSGHFRTRLEGAGLTAADAATPDGFRRLPLLSRRDIQRAGPQFFCRDVPPRHQPLGETRTSGGTGEPLAVLKTAICQLFWLALTLREHSWHPRDLAAPLAVFRANVASAHHEKDWGPPLSLLFATGPAVAIPLSIDTAELVSLLRELRPGSLLIYPSTLGAVSRLLVRTGTRLDGVRHIRTVGETLSPAVRAEAAEAFDATLADVYSSQEVGVIAIECPAGGQYHIMAESLIVEILDAQGDPSPPGTAGRVVVTDLHNFASPLIRYAIGDLAVPGTPCACGRGLPTLRSVIGRERNLVRAPDGRQYFPLVGFPKFRDVAPVAQYQVIQHEVDRIEVRLVVERAMTAAEAAALREVIAAALGFSPRIDIRIFDGRLPPRPNGKLEDFVSEVP